MAIGCIKLTYEQILEILFNITYTGITIDQLDESDKEILVENAKLSKSIIDNGCIMYHGTSSDRIEDIKIKGLRNPFLAPSKNMANDYAILRARQRDSNPILISLRIPTRLVIETISEGFWSPEDISTDNIVKIEDIKE